MKNIMFMLLLLVVTLFIVESPACGGGEIYNRTKEAISFAPPSIQTVYYLGKYTDSLGAPYRQMRRSLERETGFKDMLDFSYNPYQISSANALGPLQVLKSTGQFILPDERVTAYSLKNDLRQNLKAGTKYYVYLKNRYKDPVIAWQHYNGADSVNNYARYVAKD